MAIKLRSRKTQEISNSLWVSIPVEWVRHHNLTKGQHIEVELLNEGEAIILRPAQE